MLIVHIKSCTIIPSMYIQYDIVIVSVFTEWKYVTKDEKLIHGVLTFFYYLEPMWAHLNIFKT